MDLKRWKSSETKPEVQGEQCWSYQQPPTRSVFHKPHDEGQFKGGMWRRAMK